MNEKYEELIAEYLNGELDEQETARVEALIANGEIDMIDFKAMEQLHNELEMVSTPEPSSEMSDRFYAMLEEEKASAKPMFNISEKLTELFVALTMPRLAYAFVLLIVGGFIGAQVGSNDSQINELTDQMQDMREMMIVSMLEGASTTDRLRAVNISAELPIADEKAVRALLFTLNNDESVNVRVQTIETLKKWGEDETVREGLVSAIGAQNSDVVIIALADAMVEMGLQNSKSEFENLIQERNLNINVKRNWKAPLRRFKEGRIMKKIIGILLVGLLTVQVTAQNKRVTEGIDIQIKKSALSSIDGFTIKNINGDLKVSGYDGDEILITGSKTIRKKRGELDQKPLMRSIYARKSMKEKFMCTFRLPELKWISKMEK